MTVFLVGALVGLGLGLLFPTRAERHRNDEIEKVFMASWEVLYGTSTGDRIMAQEQLRQSLSSLGRYPPFSDSGRPFRAGDPQ